MPAHRGSVPWNKGTHGVVRPNSGSFRRGRTPWNAGSKGEGLTGPNRGSFGQPGNPGGRPLAPAGTRRWDPKGSEWLVKVDTPSPWAGRYPTGVTARGGWWRPARVVNWEREHGAPAEGLLVWRLLPICDCPGNCVLVSRAVAGTLANGRWCRPAQPWRSLPLDQELRRTAVLTAVSARLAREHANDATRPCGCGCGTRIRIFDAYGRERFYARGHSSRTGRHQENQQT